MSLASIRVGLAASLAAFALTACSGSGPAGGGGASALPDGHLARNVSSFAGRHFYVGTQNGKLNTYDEVNGSPLASLRLYDPSTAVTTVICSPDGTKEYVIPTLSPKSTAPVRIVVVNAAGTSVLGSMTFRGMLQHATISPDGSSLYAFGENGSGQVGVFVFDTVHLRLTHTVLLTQETSLSSNHNGLFVTQDGRTLYVATPSNIYRIPTATFTESVFAANPIGDVTGFALGANDTKAFVSGLHDIDVFNLSTGAMVADIGVQPGGVPIFFSMVNSPNERSLVVDGDPPNAAYFSIVDQSADTLGPAMLSEGGSGAASAINQDGSLILFYNGGPPLTGVGASTLPDGSQAYQLNVPDFAAAIAAQ